MPSLPGLRELPSAARHFLSFSTINVISWQCLIGPPLVLFGRALEMPPSLVGVLIGLLPLSMLLVIFTGPLVAWLGPRRLLTWGWLLRNLSAATVFAIPWARVQFGKPGGWLVLLCATFGFCLFRALSVGGWFPWLHEILSPFLLGASATTETAMTQLVTIMVAVGCGTILGRHDELNGFFLIYAVGIFTGLGSIGLMRRIPGGAVPAGHSADISLAPILGEHAYRRFITRNFFYLAILTGQSSVAIMYLRDILGYSDQHIMYLAAAGSLTVALLIGSWDKWSSHVDSTKATREILFFHACFALTWLALLPDRVWTGWLAIAAVIGSSFCNAAFTTTATRDMLHQVREPGRVGYTNLWIIATSLATGLVPILTGLFVDRLGLTGFRLGFLASGLGGLLAAALIRRSSGLCRS